MGQRRETIHSKRVSPESFLRVLPKPIASAPPDAEPEFDRVPKEVSERDKASLPEKPWRVILTFVQDPTHVLALELAGDVVLGANTEKDAGLHVNLVEFKNNEGGVSQRHLMLRPGKEKLFAIDLGSTNGTHISGTPLTANSARALEDGDLITLGRLHLRLKIAQRP